MKFQYIQDSSLNLYKARQDLIQKCLKDFPYMSNEFYAYKLGISVRTVFNEIQKTKKFTKYKSL